MSVKHILVCLLCGSFFAAACSAPSAPNQTKTLDELIQQERLNENNAKHRGKAPNIQVITDKATVDRLRKSVEAHIARKQKEKTKQQEAAKKNPAAAYKLGDKTVVPLLLKQLQQGDVATKKQLLDDLESDYLDDDSYQITEPALINAIFRCIYDPQLEKEAVQLAGMNKLPGFAVAMEKRLLSGQSKETGRIFYWLSHEGSQPALAYIAGLAEKGALRHEDVGEVISGMEFYSDAHKATHAAALGKLAMLIYQKGLISQKEINEIKPNVTTLGGAESLLNCLFAYGDKSIIPLAKQQVRQRQKVVAPLLALVRLEGPQHLQILHELLQEESGFYAALDIIESTGRPDIDDKMLEEMLARLSQREDAENMIRRIVDLLIKLKATAYLEYPEKYFPDKTLAQKFRRAYALRTTPEKSILADLINAGIVPPQPDTAHISNARKDAGGWPMPFILILTEAQKRYISFDTETDFVPADYDEQLQRMATITEGLLDDMLVSMDADPDKDGEHFRYRITVIYKNTAFIAQPEDVGDWYEMDTLVALLDRLIAHSGSPKRFVPVDTGDQTSAFIFGVPDKVQEILKKYTL